MIVPDAEIVPFLDTFVGTDNAMTDHQLFGIMADYFADHDDPAGETYARWVLTRRLQPYQSQSLGLWYFHKDPGEQTPNGIGELWHPYYRLRDSVEGGSPYYDKCLIGCRTPQTCYLVALEAVRRVLAPFHDDARDWYDTCAIYVLLTDAIR